MLFSYKTQLWPFKGERAGVGVEVGDAGKGKTEDILTKRKRDEGPGKSARI